LDSSVTGKEGGVLINNQLKKIRKLIEINLHKNLIFCLHHQPIAMGFWIDEIGLHNKDQFLSLILDKPNVKAVVWGHVHHESETTLGSIQFLSTPSTCYQFQENKQSVSKNKPGYRKINLFKSGRLTTSVVRVD
jgi:Icc protein